MYRKSLIFLLTFLSLNSTAAPTVTSAILDNGTLTINGSSFGSQNPMIFWDDVETSFKAQGARSGDVIKTGKTWTWKANSNWGNPFTFVESNTTRSGRKGVYYYATGHNTTLKEANYTPTTELNNKIFVSWWYKPGKSPSAQGGSNKFIRIWDDPNFNGTGISWTHMHLTCSNNGEGSIRWENWDGKVNEWNHHQIYVDLSKSTVQTWINGRLMKAATCTKHPNFPDKPLFVQVLGFDHGDSSYRDMNTAMDDIYIGQSIARVEISNQPKWSAQMVKEILPINSWSNNRISAKIVDGVVKVGNSGLYVYVYDTNGTANANGIEVSCKECPKPPY
jgi:hypothetical protein